MSGNKAAWFTGANEPLKVDDAETPKAGPNQVVVRNYAIAVNPVDWKLQSGYMLDGCDLPNVLGTDVAGEISEVGPNVKGFKVGDRVLAHAVNIPMKNAAKGAYQHYTLFEAAITAKIPSNMSYTDAAVLPLAISTAAVGLYPSELLGLPLPSTTPQQTDKIVLIWGGSSSVGATAIQLAKSSGVTVMTTASAKNLEKLKSDAGADYAFDHSSSSIVEDVLQAINSSGKTFVGAYDTIAQPDTFKTVGAILSKTSAKKLSTTLPPSDLPEDIEATFIFAGTLLNNHAEIATAVWKKFVPEALEKSTLKALPPAYVVGNGLESLQKGMDANKKGVSYAKVVIEL